MNDYERYCTVGESIKESLEEVKLIREGKIPKRNWRDSFNELKEDVLDETDACNNDGLIKDKKEILQKLMGSASSRYLDLNKIRNDSQKIMSTEESLKDVLPIDWNEDVLNGKLKVEIE